MTRKKFREKFPGEKPPTYTLESRKRKSVDNIIRRRISDNSETRKTTTRKEVVSILVIQQNSPHPTHTHQRVTKNTKQSRTS